MKTILFLALTAGLLPLAAPAASRTSANYSIPADTVDAGGRRLGSAAYTIDASIGGIGGVGTAAVPATTAKHSYIGQLYDPRGLIVSANPTNVNEGATRQLIATSLNDDGTSVGLAGSQVAWSVLSGPLTGISAGGLVTAGVVYQNEPAAVRGAYGGFVGTLGLTVLNINNDNFGTYAGDGLDDAWQVQYFGIGNANAGPGFDPDGDRQTNGYEYITGTIPTNALSKFNLRIASVPGQPTRKDLIFSPRFPTRTYAVQYALIPEHAAFVPLGGATTADVGEVRTVRDLNATNDFRIYRVFITFP